MADKEDRGCFGGIRLIYRWSIDLSFRCVHARWMLTHFQYLIFRIFAGIVSMFILLDMLVGSSGKKKSNRQK